MHNLLIFAERHLEELVFGFLAVVLCYFFARLLGARIRVSLMFALIPIVIGWAYRTGSGQALMATLLNV